MPHAIWSISTRRNRSNRQPQTRIPRIPLTQVVLDQRRRPRQMAQQPTPLDHTVQPPCKTHEPSHGEASSKPMVSRYNGILARLKRRKKSGWTRLMPGGWKGSTRSARLPGDWPQRTAYIWARDGDTCWICKQPGADQIDHKEPGDNHHPSNLAPIHQDVPPYCHRHKTSREGNAARWRYKQTRPPEPHPGLVQ